MCSMKIATAAAAAEDRFDNDKTPLATSTSTQQAMLVKLTFSRRTRHLLCVTWEFRWSFPFSYSRGICRRELFVVMCEWVSVCGTKMGESDKTIAVVLFTLHIFRCGRVSSCFSLLIFRTSNIGRRVYSISMHKFTNREIIIERRFWMQHLHSIRYTYSNSRVSIEKERKK